MSSVNSYTLHPQNRNQLIFRSLTRNGDRCGSRDIKTSYKPDSAVCAARLQLCLRDKPHELPRDLGHPRAQMHGRILCILVKGRRAIGQCGPRRGVGPGDGEREAAHAGSATAEAAG